MAITPLIQLPNPAETVIGVPITVGLLIENSETSSVTVTGIQVYDVNGVFQVGDFGAALPARFQIVSGGSPVTSSVPAWGTGTQSNITYYVGNISGSSLQTIQTSGSYGGANENFTPVSSSVIIPAGATGSFQVGLVSYNNIDFATENNGRQEGDIQARVSVEGYSTPIYSDLTQNNFISLDYKTIVGVKAFLAGGPSVIVGSQFKRPEQYVNFDLYAQAQAIFNDGTTWDIPLDVAGQLGTWSSSAPSVASILDTGLWTSTTSSYALTNSVGSVIAGQNTRISGGAGAITMGAFSANPLATSYTTISYEVGPGITGSFVLGKRTANLVSFDVFPNVVSMVSGNIVKLQAVSTLDNGLVVVLNDDPPYAPGQPTWASSDTTALPIDVSGSVTGAVNTQTTALITASGAGGLFQGTAVVTLNIIP